MSIDTTRIELQFVKSKQGQTFANGAAKVVRPHQAAKKMYVIAACTACGREEKFPARLLGSALQYANENVTGWRCTDPVCVPRTAPTPETDVRKMSADEYRKTVVEPEHLMRQARAQAAQGVPLDQQRQYAKVFRAFGISAPGIDEREHPDFFSGATFFAMPAATRAAWVKWAEDTIAAVAEQRKQAAAEEERLRKLRVKYVRLAEAFKQIRKLDELSKYPLQAYISDTPESRQTLDNYADSVLGAGV